MGGGNYGVDQGTKRQQMAVFLLKAKNGLCYVPPTCTGTFTDVTCPSTFADWIEDLADQGITSGCGGGLFCPNNLVTRRQMAVFLLKTKYGSSYVPPACTGVFDDVACPGAPAVDFIERLAAEQITGGCSGLASPLLPGQLRQPRPDGHIHHEDLQSAMRTVVRWRDSSYRRGKRWPAACVQLGVPYCRGLASGGRVIVKTFRTAIGGSMRRVVLATLWVISASTLAAATFTVTNTDDTGAGSFRQAILDANGSPGLDTIAFNIPGAGVHTISPATALPFITDPVIVDGYTQPGASPNTDPERLQRHPSDRAERSQQAHR